MLAAESERVPCLINGDDILFQTSKEVSNCWMNTVCKLGLEVETSKTSVAKDYGSLNSTLLRWAGDDLLIVPTLRFGRLKSTEYVSSLPREYSQWLTGLKNGFRFRAGVVFFKRHLLLLRSVRLSLLEIGFRGSLACRLSFLFGLVPSGPPVEKPPPCPVGHNVQVSLDVATRVLEEEIGQELCALNAREVACWKFGLGFELSVTRSRILYALRLSSIRSIPLPEFSCREGWRGRLSQPSRSERYREALRWFSEPVIVQPKTVAVFDSLLASQYADYTQLPSYGESVGSECPSAIEVGEKKGSDPLK